MEERLVFPLVDWYSEHLREWRYFAEVRPNSVRQATLQFAHKAIGVLYDDVYNVLDRPKAISID